MTSIVLATLGLIASGAVTGFAFAGGATAFQETVKEIKQVSAKKPEPIDTIHRDRGRAEGRNPFNNTRFLSDLEKRELTDILKNPT